MCTPINKPARISEMLEKLGDDFRLLEKARLLEPSQRLGNLSDRLGESGKLFGGAE